MKSTLLKWLVPFILVILKNNVLSFRCDRRPYGTTSPSSPADGRFSLNVVGGHEAYLPDQLYTIQIVATDGQSTFTGFMISAEGDLKPEPNNPRRMMSLPPGEIRPQSQYTAKFSDRCLYSVEQLTNNLKDSVEVYWQAPPSGNGCVTLRAMVAENDNVWFEDGAPLTMKICEDMRQPDDLALQLNEECQICDEAKYEISFTGIWSRNTHPRNFPENDWVPKYSDLVGASHTHDFILWSPGVEASDGLRQLAEYANTSALESEIFGKIGDGARTLIKGKGHGNLKMNLPTYAFFRTDKDHHMISVAVGIHPSPDWFLGVARFELCQGGNTWLQERELNLFPWDAGTDSGVSYESPNIVTFPQDTVTRVQTSSYDKNSPFFETDFKDLHPFGRLHIKLVRTYHKECVEATSEDTTESATEESEGEENEGEENENSESSETISSQPEEPSRYQYPDLSSDSGGEPEEPKKVEHHQEVQLEECVPPAWQGWSKCEGACDNGIVKGYKWRVREHKPSRHGSKESVKLCKVVDYQTFDYKDCEEKCQENEGEQDLNAEKRTMSAVLPGQPWSKKRELKKIMSSTRNPLIPFSHYQ